LSNTTASRTAVSETCATLVAVATFLDNFCMAVNV